MSDPSTSNLSGSGELITLADALRALPLAAPPEGAWSQLASSLAQSAAVASKRPVAPARRYRRFALPAALAAAIVAAVIAMLSPHVPHATKEIAQVEPAATKARPDASSVHNATNDANATNPELLTDAQNRSHVLERWLRDTGKDSAAQSAQDIAASAEIEDMIGIVDMQLADQPEDNAALPLWRRRVALLEDLATLRYGANLHQFKTGLLASETSDARHATWNN